MGNLGVVGVGRTKPNSYKKARADSGTGNKLRSYRGGKGWGR